MTVCMVACAKPNNVERFGVVLMVALCALVAADLARELDELARADGITHFVVSRWSNIFSFCVFFDQSKHPTLLLFFALALPFFDCPLGILLLYQEIYMHIFFCALFTFS